MIRLDLATIYLLKDSFRPIRDLSEDDDRFSAWLTIYTAQEAVNSICWNSVYSSALRGTTVPGLALYNYLNTISSQKIDEIEMTSYAKAHMVRLLDNFEIVLQSELSISDAYFVSDKPPFQTITLVNRGETLFPSNVNSKCPEAMPDLKDAGKCLAFELCTACGFHIMRALESVLRRYWVVVTNGEAHPEQRNIGVYLNLLEKKKLGDPKIIGALRQIKDLHRNPLSHPDVVLTLEEAISLIGVARGVASAMLANLPELEFKLTPPDDAEAERLLASPSGPA